MGHFFRSDGRGHGSHTLSPECADELAAKLATEAHWLPVGAKQSSEQRFMAMGIFSSDMLIQKNLVLNLAKNFE